MRKTNKIFLIILLAVALLYQSSLFLRQCTAIKSIELVKEIYGDQTMAADKNIRISSRFENGILKIQSKSVTEFLFLTNQNGNIVETLTNIAICFSLLYFSFRLRPYQPWTVDDLKAANLLFFLFMAKLFIHFFAWQYTSNWFVANPLFHNSGYVVKPDYLDIFTYIVTVIILKSCIQQLKTTINRIQLIEERNEPILV